MWFWIVKPNYVKMEIKISINIVSLIKKKNVSLHTNLNQDESNDMLMVLQNNKNINKVYNLKMLY